MPIVIQDNGSLLITTVSGTITAEELMTGAREMGEIEARQSTTLPRLYDLSEVVALHIDFSTMHQFALLRNAAKLKQPTRAAIFAPSPLQYGFARMYQTLSGNPNLQIKVFREKDAAMNWLESK